MNHIPVRPGSHPSAKRVIFDINDELRWLNELYDEARNGSRATPAQRRKILSMLAAVAINQRAVLEPINFACSYTYLGIDIQRLHRIAIGMAAKIDAALGLNVAQSFANDPTLIITSELVDSPIGKAIVVTITKPT